MHPNNLHQDPYPFPELIEAYPPLKAFVFTGEHGHHTIDFSNYEGVYSLNKAILLHQYGLKDYDVPAGYLCPPVPGRVDYLHHIADLIQQDTLAAPIKGLDIGTGANAIYSLLGHAVYNWHMIGADISETAVAAAKNNVLLSGFPEGKIEIRQQKDNALIFEGIIAKDEYYHFSMCNPPFHASEKEAGKAAFSKLKNLHNAHKEMFQNKDVPLNFGGQANELWCNGGEALFIKRMIKQSLSFKNQVGWFTTLVSQKEHLAKIYKQLDKAKATHTTLQMAHGNKKSRIVAWTFKEL